LDVDFEADDRLVGGVGGDGVGRRGDHRE
jgi:hypothetical protein